MYLAIGYCGVVIDETSRHGRKQSSAIPLVLHPIDKNIIVLRDLNDYYFSPFVLYSNIIPNYRSEIERTLFNVCKVIKIVFFNIYLIVETFKIIKTV